MAHHHHPWNDPLLPAYICPNCHQVKATVWFGKLSCLGCGFRFCPDLDMFAYPNPLERLLWLTERQVNIPGYRRKVPDKVMHGMP